MHLNKEHIENIRSSKLQRVCKCGHFEHDHHCPDEDAGEDEHTLQFCVAPLIDTNTACDCMDFEFSGLVLADGTDYNDFCFVTAREHLGILRWPIKEYIK